MKRRRDDGVCVSVPRILILAAALTWSIGLCGRADAADHPSGSSWSWKSPEKVLWVVNASRAARTPPLTVGEPLPVAGLLGVMEPRRVQEEFTSGALRFIETPSGLVVVAMKGESGTVSLRAVESLSGRIRWEKKGFNLGKKGGFLPIGNIILVRAAGGEEGLSLSALDLHDGRELWRNGEIASERLRVLALPRLGIALLRSHPSEPVRLLALDLATGTIRWQLSGSGVRKRAGSLPVNSWLVNARTLALPSLQLPSTASRYEFWAEFPAYYQTYENFLTATQSGGDLILLTLTEYHHRQPPTLALQRIDLETGRVTWERLAGNVLSLAVIGDRVFAWEPSRVVVLDRVTGVVIADAPTDEREAPWADPASPREMSVYGDVLLLRRSGTDRESQPYVRRSSDVTRLRALDARDGMELWRLDLPDDGTRRFVVVSEALVDAWGDTVTSRVLRTGKVTATYHPRLARPIVAMSLTDDAKLLLRTVNQVAKLDPATGRELFNTGEIASPVRAAASGESFLSSLLAGAVVGVAHAFLRTQAGTPPDVTRATAEMRLLEGLSRPRRVVAERGFGEGRSLEGSDNLFFPTRDEAGLRLLRVDARSGEKTVAAPYRFGKGVATVVDDFNGVAVEIDGDTLRGVPYSLADGARSMHRFADAYGSGIEAGRRGAALRRAGRTEAAIVELTFACARLDEALGLGLKPAETIPARMAFAESSLTLADLDPSGAAGRRATARRELEKVVEDGENAGPAWSSIVGEARAQLARIQDSMSSD